MFNEAASYRKREGRDQAIVTLTDKKTKVRRDYYLGPYDSPESKQLYYRLVAEWESSGGKLPACPNDRSRNAQQILTIDELSLAYWRHCEGYYLTRPQGWCRIILPPTASGGGAERA